MTPEQARKQEEWSTRIMETAREMSRLEIEIDDLTKKTKERKKELEAYQTRYKELGEQGPFGGDNQPDLFDQKVDEDSIKKLKLPTRLISNLESAGIKTINRLETVLEGLDPEFPEGLNSIESLDEDSKKRIEAEFSDVVDEQEDMVQPTVPHAPPMPQSIEGGEPSNLDQCVSVKLRVDLEEASKKAGDIVEATVGESGQAFYRYGDSDDDVALLESGEFELTAV